MTLKLKKRNQKYEDIIFDEKCIHFGPLSKKKPRKKIWTEYFFVVGLEYIHYYTTVDSSLISFASQGCVKTTDIISVTLLSNGMLELKTVRKAIMLRGFSEDDAGFCFGFFFYFFLEVWVKAFRVVKWLCDVMDVDEDGLTYSQSALVHFGESLVKNYSEIGGLLHRMIVEV